MEPTQRPYEFDIEVIAQLMLCPTSSESDLSIETMGLVFVDGNLHAKQFTESPCEGSQSESPTSLIETEPRELDFNMSYYERYCISLI